jgi:ABC-2 type transport system ATP-binding protein
MSPAMLAEVRGLGKAFGRRWVLSGLSFAIGPGEIVGLIGANGAGKTTTLALLLGLLTPSAGEIHILGEDMIRHRYRVLPRINFTSPYFGLPGRLSVASTLRLYAHLYDVPKASARIAALAATLGLTALLEAPVLRLSAGERSRVGLAKALLNDPELLLLDEPTASLDPESAEIIREALLAHRARRGGAILLSSHNMAEVGRLCDRLLLLRQGRLVAEGAPQVLCAAHGVADLEALFFALGGERAAPAPR